MHLVLTEAGVTFRKFYAIENDLIGGWDVSEHDKPASQHDLAAGERTIGSFLTFEWATIVAEALSDLDYIPDDLV